MQPQTSDNLDNVMGLMWETHREFLRRFLIGLTRDIDLADDLLQETYLKAHAGIGGYQGGDPRAWLSAIAKSSFYSHLRHRYVRCEIALDDGCEVSGPSVDHLDLIEVRRAISELPDAQRRALVMKHYGGYNYEDIAAHMGCPLGTAKSRVSSALRRLREALAVPREEIAVVKCADLAERTLMDFVYGRMPDPERKRVEEHLAGCESCRDRVGEVVFVLRALDAVEADHRGTFIAELHEDGTSSFYMFVTDRNDADEPKKELTIGVCSAVGIIFVNGQEAEIKPFVEGSDENQKHLHLEKPIVPGERMELLMIVPRVLDGATEDMGDGRWSYGPAKLNFDRETVYVMAIRLPVGATFERATPEPQEVRRNGATTVVWRDVLEPGVERAFGVGYRV